MNNLQQNTAVHVCVTLIEKTDGVVNSSQQMHSQHLIGFQILQTSMDLC